MIEWNLTLKDDDKKVFKKALFQTVFFMITNLIITSLIFYYSSGLSKLVCGILILFTLIYNFDNILFWKAHMDIADCTIANHLRIKNKITNKKE